VIYETSFIGVKEVILRVALRNIYKMAMDSTLACTAFLL